MPAKLEYFLRAIMKVVAKLVVRVFPQGVLLEEALLHYEYPKIKSAYGDFEFGKSYDEKHITGLNKESGAIRGVIVANVEKTRAGCKRVLLPGEYNRDKVYYAGLFGVPEQDIVTAGIGDDMDYQWNYEENPPFDDKFDYCVSQAMLEHLIDPFKHAADLANLLNPGGHLILHTHPPGFFYHRHPIDCMRFFPDWFEEIAPRLGLSVVHRYLGELRVCYTYVKLADRDAVS